MKLLVTGGLGFIGSSFILMALKKFDIVNLDAGFYGSNKLNLEHISNFENYEFVDGNITDSSIIEKLVSDCDAVVNFAAESFVDRSISDAKPFLKSNVDGVFTILESIKKNKKRVRRVGKIPLCGDPRKQNRNTNKKSKLYINERQNKQ